MRGLHVRSQTDPITWFRWRAAQLREKGRAWKRLGKNLTREKVANEYKIGQTL
jgi:hypothetical protein